jgi:hypothetical protein
MKNSNDTIGNRSHDLLFCSAVPQPLRHHMPPVKYIYIVYHIVSYHNKLIISIIGPTVYTICFQFITVNSLYMCQALIYSSSGGTIPNAVYTVPPDDKKSARHMLRLIACPDLGCQLCQCCCSFSTTQEARTA